LLKIKGKYLPSSFFNLQTVKFTQDKNLIDIQNIKFNKNNKIQSIDEINLNIFNNNDNPSKLSVKRKKKNYSIAGEIFDGTKLVDEILFSKNDIDGGLIGGASLKSDDFIQILASFK